MQLWDIEAYPELSIKGRFQRDENGDEVWVVVAKRTWQFDGEVWHELGDSEIFDDPSIWAKKVSLRSRSTKSSLIPKQY